MKILLVVYDNDSYIHWFPQGLAYIAAVLRKEGHEVFIYSQDRDHFSEEHLTYYLDQNHFDIIGVSVIGGYYQYKKLLELSQAIHRSQHKPFYIIGGHGPSPDPAYFFRKTLADAIVIGEGELTVVELVDAIGNARSLSQVKGIAYRNGEEVIITEERPLIQEVDMIPWPAYDLFPIDYYRLIREPLTSNHDFVMPMLSGRGCPFKCNFCYRLDKGFRPRSHESIVEEISFLKQQYGITYIAFSDDLLMSSEERTVELCEAFLAAQLNIKWSCNGRLNYAKPEVLTLMKRAGFVFINYGIEAMDNQILRNMKKGLTTDMVTRGVEATLKVGISPGLNIIWGNIGETRETLAKGVEFLLKYSDASQRRTIRPVTPYPGSPLYYYAIEKKLLRDCEDFYENKHKNSDLLAVNFTHLTDEEFHEALLEANTRLLEDYFQKQFQASLEQAKQLYLDKDTSFRGFRTT